MKMPQSDFANILARQHNKHIDKPQLATIANNLTARDLIQSQVDTRQPFEVRRQSVHKQRVQNIAGNAAKIGIRYRCARRRRRVWNFIARPDHENTVSA